MSRTVIEVENLSKQYRLGSVGTGTLSHDINRWWHLVRGKEDPFLKIGEENNRTTKGESDLVWALKNISFDVKQGEVLGIIGRNGAGKSTLLKVLSRTTKPSIGSLKVKGRIASLLEVGTGFHPELTGKENIFLNGAILGMTKNEIKRKFDEIVDFSGVERYIDTPVKRYSSGMYVRLAFAVAAHLESEILIVDEVLAVGDAEFQKKCLGKMGEISKGQGRTVLFVSHNMSAISNLCTTSLLLRYGQVVDKGLTRNIIEKYIGSGNILQGSISQEEMNFSSINPNLKIKKISLVGNQGISHEFGLDEKVCCEVEFEVKEKPSKVVTSIHLLDKYGEVILSSLNSNSATISPDPLYNKVLEKGMYTTRCEFPAFFLNDASYKLNVIVSEDESFTNVTRVDEVLSFEMHDTGEMKKEYTGSWIGLIRPKLFWNTTKQ
jgi:lipopolysaccharide transport system ATP-binding protein